MRVEGIPHNWIFTKVGAIVHHGGVGTAAAAFRAGVPSVFVPHIFDQEYWGERAFELGVAPPPINRKDLSAERLSAAVRQATGAAGMRERAVRLAEALRGEDGTGNAVSLAEAYFNDGHVAVVKGESLRERGGEGNEEAAGDIENASPLLARE
jgi:UDP:flavonoid glycosyltransferase YjiC (YdhE family)